MGETGNIEKQAPPFLVRHRRAMAAAAFAVLLLFFALHAHHWHFPFRPRGALGEWPLLAGALAAGAAFAFALTAARPRLARARAAVGALAAIVAFVALRSADPFAGARSWLYAPAGCDFAVSFPRRAGVIAGEAKLEGAAPQPVIRALTTDLGEALTLSAECVVFARALGDAEKAAALNAAEAQLKASAARLRIKIERFSRAGTDSLALSGFSDEGRTATNVLLLRRAEARAVLGSSSLLVLWAWKIGREGETQLFGQDFFASMTQRKSVAYGQSR